MSMYSVLCCWKRVFATTSAFSWQNSAALCFILYSEVKFACYFRYFLTSYFCILVPYNEKGIFFGCSSLQVNYSIFTYDILGTALNTFISLFFFFLVMPHGLQNLIFPARNWTLALTVKMLNPNHWTIRECPVLYFLLVLFERIQLKVIVQITEFNS